jgi:D-serine deaminase-like pyridoxal phosphate-dependent protein
VRVRGLLGAILDRDPGFRGLMTFTLRETLFLGEHGFGDMLLAYPTTDRHAIGALSRTELEQPPVLMVDSTDHLDLIDAAAERERQPVRVAIEIDLSYRLPGGRLIGPKRSPVRTADQAVALALEIQARPGFELAGLMGYEGHIAGVGDRPRGRRLYGLALHALQRASAREIADRRSRIADRRSPIAESSSGDGCTKPIIAT